MLSRDVAATDLQNPNLDELAQFEELQWATLINFLEYDGLPNAHLALPLNDFGLNMRCLYRVSTISYRILKQVVFLDICRKQ